MPELVTHTLAAVWVRRRAHHHYPMLLLGAVLPDLLHRGSLILMNWTLRPELPGPEKIPAGWYLTLFNAPVGVVAVAYLIALLCETAIRRDVFRWLVIGISLHFLLDGLQRTLPGAVSYFWFFPLSWTSGTIGLYWPEDSLYAIPALLIIVLIREWHLRRKGK